MRPLARVIISKRSDAGNYCEQIQAEWRKFLRRAGKMPNDRMFLTWHGDQWFCSLT
jgi:hypothetical protein